LWSDAAFAKLYSALRDAQNTNEDASKLLMRYAVTMEQRSPTLEGFRVMFGQPAFGLAEISWRWSVGLAACLLATFSFFGFLDTLPVTRGDLLLFRSRQPVLVAKALARVLHGNGARVIATFVVLAVCLAVAWVVVSALGRAATVKEIFGHFRRVPLPAQASASKSYKIRSLWGLNFFRAVALLAAGVACLAPLALTPMMHSEDPALAFLFFATVVTMVFGAWCAVNWFLSVAALFVVGNGEDTFGAMVAMIDMCRTRPGPVFAVGTWFGLARLGLFTIAAFLVMTSVGLLGVLPVGLVLLGILCVTLFYFAVADFLYIGRMAAYAAVAEMPGTLVPISKPPDVSLPETRNPHGMIARAESIDPDELILSDIPAPA
jgi:hypothetical protein